MPFIEYTVKEPRRSRGRNGYFLPQSVVFWNPELPPALTDYRAKLCVDVYSHVRGRDGAISWNLAPEDAIAIGRQLIAIGEDIQRRLGSGAVPDAISG